MKETFKTFTKVELCVFKKPKKYTNSAVNLIGLSDGIRAHVPAS